MSSFETGIHPDSKAIVLCTVVDIDLMIHWINQQSEEDYPRWTYRERQLLAFKRALQTYCLVCETAWPALTWRHTNDDDGNPVIVHRCPETNTGFRVMADHELGWI